MERASIAVHDSGSKMVEDFPMNAVAYENQSRLQFQQFNFLPLSIHRCLNNSS
jgi:hypothetical protein